VEALVAAIQQRPKQRGTNLGGVFKYMQRTITSVEGDRTAQQARGRRVPPAPLYVAVVLTDGHADGKQTELPEKIAASSVHVAFWGGATGQAGEEGRHLGQRAGLQADGQMETVPFGYWESRAPAFGDSFGRPADTQLVETLRAGKPVERPF